MFNPHHTPAFFSRCELNDDQIRSVAPSVFAAAPLPEVSARYAFVPTAQIVSRLRTEGWSPVMASQQAVKLEGRRGFQKHLLRFQRRDVQPVAGEFAEAGRRTRNQSRRNF